MRKHKLNGFAFVNVILLLGVVAVTLYPFLHLIAISLSSPEYVLRSDVSIYPKGLTFDIYQIIIQDGRLLLGYRNTLIYVVLGTFISLSFTAMGAYALSKEKLLFRKQILMLIIVTVLFSGGMIPTFLVVQSLGLVDTVWAMVLPSALSTWYLIIMRTYFVGLPNELEEAATVDGLGDLGIFFRIILPLSKPILATIGLFYAVGIWNNYWSALVYLRSQELYPLQVFLRNLVMSTTQASINAKGSGARDVIVSASFVSAVIMFSTIPILVVYPFLQKYFVKGMLIGSIKG